MFMLCEVAKLNEEVSPLDVNMQSNELKLPDHDTLCDISR